MPYNGAGTFTLYSPGNPVVTGTTISSTWANNTLTDLATGLSTALTKDGQTTPTANIPMGGFKLTGLAAGSATGDSVRYGQLGALAFLGTVGTSQIDASSVTAAKLNASAAANSNLIGGYIEWSVSGNALTLAVKANSGSDPSASEPVLYAVRDATAATAAPTFRTLTAALSLTVPDTALLGTFNSTAFRLWAVIFNDAGTDRLGVINCATISANAGSGYNVTDIYPLAGWGIASSTAVGIGSDSSATFYTDSAVTSKAYAVAGYATWESGLATAGTWSAAPTREQLWGPGIALPGQTVALSAVTKTTAAAGNAGAVPQDDSIPQSGEGNQLMDTVSITPSSAANALRFRHIGSYAHDGAASVWAASLFRDAVANSLNTAINYSTSNNTPHEAVLEQAVLSSTTSQTDFKVRVGNNSNNTFTINGNAGSRIYGGAAGARSQVEEVMT